MDLYDFDHMQGKLTFARDVGKRRHICEGGLLQGTLPNHISCHLSSLL